MQARLGLAPLVLVLGLLSGCNNDKQLQEDEAHLQQTINNLRDENTDKLQDAQTKGEELKHGEHAACQWLRKQNFKYVGPRTRSWQEACDAMYPVRKTK
jgi:hypothetical protein